MTRAIEAMKEALVSRGMRALANDIGVSHQTVKNFIDRGGGDARTEEKVRRWMAKQDAPPEDTAPDAAPVAAPDELEAIMRDRKLDEIARVWMVEAYAAARRARAMERAEEAALERARAMTSDARSAGVRAGVAGDAPRPPDTDATTPAQPPGQTTRKRGSGSA
jgi:hypothetical protein